VQVAHPFVDDDFSVKMDILKRNLAAGMQVRQYVPSYANQPNDAAHVIKCIPSSIVTYFDS